MSKELQEQIAVQPGKRQQGKAIRFQPTLYASVHSVGEAEIPEENLSPTDEPIEEDDAFYNTRKPSSTVNRGKIPLTPAETRTPVRVMRVTRHAEPFITPRASLRGQQTQPQRKHKPVKKTVRRLHWLFYAGCGALASLTLWALGSVAFSWLQVQHDNALYGYPRTYQVDANVDHAGISHFISENLNGDIIVLELHPSNLAATKVYQGPVFAGPGADDYIATLSFKDLGNGKLDMIIAVNNQRFVLINDGTGFRPSTPADHIDQQEVN